MRFQRIKRLSSNFFSMMVYVITTGMGKRGSLFFYSVAAFSMALRCVSSQLVSCSKATLFHRLSSTPVVPPGSSSNMAPAGPGHWPSWSSVSLSVFSALFSTPAPVPDPLFLSLPPQSLLSPLLQYLPLQRHS